jgi:hypothetical protein
MIKSINILTPIRVEFESKSELYFVDPFNSSVYELNGKLATEEVSKLIFQNLYSQQEALMPNVPMDQINEVINTEKKLAEENVSHVFRRGQDARN